MYSRCVRCAVSRSLSRQQLSQLPRRRFLVTAESTPTTADATPSAALVETDKSSESWNTTSSSTVGDAISFELPDDTTLDDAIEREVSSSKRPTSSVAATKEQDEVEDTRSYGIHIIPENKALNMPGILAVVRDLEKRFGRVAEFRILRDKDSPSDYMKTLFINFGDQESVREIQETFRGAHSGSIMVGAPPEWNRSKELDGGVSLEDVQTYLRPARPHTASEKRNEGDKRLEEAIGSVEKALEMPEAEVEVPGREGATLLTTTAADGCECRIEILGARSKASVISNPFLHEKPRRMNPKQRVHFARSLIQWGGFYPHYRFTASTHEDDGLGSSKVAESTDGTTEEERKRAETVRIATRAMRASLVRARIRLRDLGEPDHGLEMRDGRNVVLDWEPKDINEGSRDASKATVETDVNANAKNAEGVVAALGQSKTAKTKWAKPKALTPEEEENLDRLFARSNGRRAQPEAKASPPSAEGAAQTSPKAVPFQSQSQSAPISTLDPWARAEAKPKAPSTPPTLIAASQERQPVVTKEVENNRARRAMRKAEQEERAGFKSKLLGWLGR